MKKKKESILSKWFLVLAIGSAFVALLEGVIYYTVEAYPNVLFRYMLILQNCIKAFEFKADIGLKDMANFIKNNKDLIKDIIAYVYTISLFIAPYCTLTLVYKVIAKIFKFRTWRHFPSNARRIIVFGYNDAVKALIRNSGEEKRRIHLVTTDVSEKDEREFINKRIILHQVDCLGMAQDQLEYFAKEMELDKATDIILYEDSSAKNFSLYNLFHSINIDSRMLKKDVKFFCRCEDDSIKRILEDYYDTRIRDKKAMITSEEKVEIEVFKDLEIVNIPELRIRKMLNEHPLHNYHLNKKTSDLHEWNLHLLIVGFGKLGQQLLLQAMNQGVITSKNKILIDVIDFNIEEKKSIFANNFSDEYVCMNGNEYTITSIDNEKADGDFKIRFHKMDIRYKQFYEILKQNGSQENGGIYTYISICVPDAEISLHCMSEVERYLRSKKCDKDVCLGIRMETDRQMANYLNRNTKTYNNVFAIEENEYTITMDDLLMDKLDADAKMYNCLYNNISIMTEDEYEAINIIERDSNKNDTYDLEYVTKYWRELEIFRRNSNRALANHREVKKEFFKCINEKEIEDAIGKNGTLMKDVGAGWVIVGDAKKFADKLSDTSKYPNIGEVAKLEHRRWCYFMASCGWKGTDSPNQKKNDIEKKSPYMCTWEYLKKHNPDMCRYDMMPILLEYKEKNDKRQ